MIYQCKIIDIISAKKYRNEARNDNFEASEALAT